MKMTEIGNALGKMAARLTSWLGIAIDGVIDGSIALPDRVRGAIGGVSAWIKIKLDPNLAAKRKWILAAADGDLETLKKLFVEAPGQIDAMLPKIAFSAADSAYAEMTPLMAAIQTGGLDCVECLIPWSNLDTKKRAVGQHKGGHTAMIQAALNGNPEVVDAMLRAVSAEQLNARNGFGATALLAAVTFGRLAAARKIIADPRCDRQAKVFGNDALMTAMQGANLESVALVAPFSTLAQREAAFRHGVNLAQDWEHASVAPVAWGGKDLKAAQWACIDELASFVPVGEALRVFGEAGKQGQKWMPKTRALMEEGELRRVIDRSGVSAGGFCDKGEEPETAAPAVQKNSLLEEKRGAQARKANRL